MKFYEIYFNVIAKRQTVKKTNDLGNELAKQSWPAWYWGANDTSL